MRSEVVFVYVAWGLPVILLHSKVQFLTLPRTGKFSSITLRLYFVHFLIAWVSQSLLRTTCDPCKSFDLPFAAEMCLSWILLLLLLQNRRRVIMSNFGRELHPKFLMVSSLLQPVYFKTFSKTKSATNLNLAKYWNVSITKWKPFKSTLFLWSLFSDLKKSESISTEDRALGVKS